jgi:EpsI family protein
MSAMRLAVAVALVGTTGMLAAGPNVTPGAAVFDIPYTIAGWQGADAEPIDPDVQRALGADVLLNRTYADAGGPVGFYLAYYAEQRPGVSIHSPRHCLPGTGWEVLSDRSISVPLDGGVDAPMRRLVAERDGAAILVLYAYWIHGRLIASDLLSRVHLIREGLEDGRNDAALVRVVVPMSGSEEAAQERGAAFVRALVPYL